jgi:hypothetical protein
MSNTKHAPRHARSNTLVAQPQVTAMPAGSVTAIDGAGLPFLTKVMNSIGWWASGNVKTSEETWPANPHWH